MSATTASGRPVVNRPKARPKVAPFARYEGTSAWTKYRQKVRAYARFRAEAKKAPAAQA